MSRIPVTILTGFLGAGKTTLLNRLIAQPGFGDTAIVVNEFGDVGVDGVLIAQSDERAFAQTVGCLCCTVSGDVRLTLLRLLEEAERGLGPGFDRVIIETTGMADPAPLIQAFISNDFILSRFALNGVVTLVDAVDGLDAISRFREARRQVAVADMHLIAKCDLAPPPDRLIQTLSRLNPNARRLRAEAISAEDLFSLAAFDPAGKAPDVAAWLRFDAEGAAAARGDDDEYDHSHDHGHDHEPCARRATDIHDHAHQDAAQAICYTTDAPVDAQRFETALDDLRYALGPDLLRAKGLVAIAGLADRPRLVHIAGHIQSPPRLLDDWPAGVEGTRLVVITSGPNAAAALRQFQAALPCLRAVSPRAVMEPEPG